MRKKLSEETVKNRRYTFRMNQKEVSVLEAAAEKMNVKPSEIVRMGVFAVGLATLSEV